jgi:thiopeptide-type bacteriocin biosynthesis protein
MYVPLRTFLLRAPLLPEAALGDAMRAFARSPLHETALALASPATAGASDSRARRRTLDRYGRRAAFRATPHGLLAGVCLGELAPQTRIATGTPAAHLAPTWQQMAALGRALLDEREVRERVRLRAAPSLGRSATTVRWLGPGEPFAEGRQAALDARLGAVLDATSRWTPWAAARRASRAGKSGGDDDEEIDDWLLLLIDEGLLHADVAPPLVGPPPGTWMRTRLASLARDGEARVLDGALAALSAGDLQGGRRRLEELPVAATVPALHGTLIQLPRRTPTLARAVVRRAAALAPLLFRLQEALVPPASERVTQAAMIDALDAATETFGAGALDLEALEAGDYGVEAGEDEENDAAPPQPPAPTALLTALLDAINAALAAGHEEAELDAGVLAAALGGAGDAPPPTCELFLAPAARTRGAREGAGWLLGLHAPGGASWGRFAAALGAPLERALHALARAERAARPDREVLDVAFAPCAALADLCTHPPIRRRRLALTSWSAAEDDAAAQDDAAARDDAAAQDDAAAGAAPRARDLTPRDLELVADLAAAEPLALRERRGAPVVPSPLARVRSTTAPAGTTRLLCGWSLRRQHAPWALALGPLADLARLPRLVLAGFVVSPASWRLPAAGRDGRLGRAQLRRWRREARPPRWVQVGHEDQLLPVDLDGPTAADDLAGHERVWEIWPPLGRTVDRDGRRVEAVVALVDRPDAALGAAHAHAARATAAAGRVPPPRLAPPAPGFRTYKVFGAPEHADALLLDAIRPAVAAALRAREITRWFFLRYVDAPGRRHHLRVRVHSSEARARAAFEARLERALARGRSAGAVVTVETADYHPEGARYGAALPAAHEIFQSDSDAACALLGEEDASSSAAPDRLTQVVRSLDALARGLGLDLDARHALARSRRDAEERQGRAHDDGGGAGDDAARAIDDAEFRVRARTLRALIGAPVDGAAARALRVHVTRTSRAARALTPEARAALAPALLHLACVRLAGPDRDLERRAYIFWERTLEGLRRGTARPQ